MILLKIERLFYISGVLLLIFVPFLNLLAVPVQGIPGEQQLEISIQLIPVIVIMELLIYLILGFLSGGVTTFFQVVQYSFLTAFFRLLSCFIGGALYSLYQPLTYYNSLLLFWVGSPVVVLLQIFLLLMLSPYLVMHIAPGILSDRAKSIATHHSPTPSPPRPTAFRSEASPVGGFVRVYSYEELGRLFRNIIGIEGYILYTWEGLMLWQNSQIILDSDRLIASFQKQWKDQCERQKQLGFRKPERTIIQSVEHNFIQISFNKNFFGIFIFRTDVDIDEVFNRLKYLERSARELFEMKYSAEL